MAKGYQPNDKYAQKAKEMGYRARSFFKLQEIQNRYRLIKKGDKVLDLGAAPGSFMQYLHKVVGAEGLVVGIDLKPIEPFELEDMKTYVADIFEEPVYEQIRSELGVELFDVITSDLAPSTTGIRSVDAGRSFQLSERVIEVAKQRLRSGGNLVIKAFPGADHSELIRLMKAEFKQVKSFKPDAVRASSREVYLLGLKKK